MDPNELQTKQLIKPEDRVSALGENLLLNVLIARGTGCLQ